MHFHKAVAVPPVVLLIEPTHKQQFGHGIKVIIATYVSLVAIDKRMNITSSLAKLSKHIKRFVLIRSQNYDHSHVWANL